MTVEWAFETCMPQCAPEARHFLHPPWPSKGSAAETVHVLFFPPGVRLPGAQSTHTGPSSVENPGEPPVALFPAFIIARKWTPVLFHRERAAI